MMMVDHVHDLYSLPPIFQWYSLPPEGTPPEGINT